MMYGILLSAVQTDLVVAAKMCKKNISLAILTDNTPRHTQDCGSLHGLIFSWGNTPQLRYMHMKPEVGKYFWRSI
jgi:hypothetical protein